LIKPDHFPPRENTPGFPGAGKLLSSRGQSMAAISDAWFYRLKAAQRDLIKMVGGIERAAEITSISKSHVGRWNNATDPDLMPINAALLLEAECGVPLITSV